MTDDSTGPRQPTRDLDADETHQTDATPDRSRTYRAFAWLTDNLINVVAGLAIGAFILASFLDVSVPRNLKIIGLSAIISLILFGKPTGKKTVSLLWDPSYIWLVDLDAAQRTSAIYRIPSQRFREWSVTDGELDWATPELAFGKSVSLEEQTVEGTWRGTLTDRELLIALENVKRCRGTLEKRAQKGDVFEATGFIIVRNAVSHVVNTIRETFERGTLADDGAALDREINEAIEEFGINRSLDDLVDDDADPTTDVADLDVDLDALDLDADDLDAEPEVPADD